MAGFLRPLVSMIVMLSLASCAFREDTEEIRYLKAKQDVENGVGRITFKRSEIQTTFVPGRQLNEYSAKISWPKGRPVHVRISQSDTVLDTFERDAQNSIELPCIDQTLDFKVETIIEGGEITSTHQFRDKCPVDSLVSGKMTAAHLARGLNGRLRFSNGSELLLTESDFGLRLKLTTIEVESGVGTIRIVADAPTLSGSAEFPSSSVSHLTIIAQKATGALRFELNGVDGLKGTDSDKVIPADPKLNGVSGSPAVLDSEYACRMVGPRGDQTRECKVRCVTPPTSGQPGKPGANSVARGDNGKAGVGTSPVSLLVDQPIDFRVTFAFNPGRGGEGGNGGKGQPGGLPGASGANPDNFCPAAPAAGAGSNGSQGPKGYQGPDGGCGRLTLTEALKGHFELIDVRSECSKTTNLIRFVD